MSPDSRTSSSDGEPEHGQPEVGGSVFAEPIKISTSTPAASSSPKRSKNGKLKRMLQLVLEAVRTIPCENQAKGTSIQKIKKYLKDEHSLRKMDIQDQLRPTLETAIKRKMLVKTAGRVSVLIGSVKLHPAFRGGQGKNTSSADESSSADEEPTDEEKQMEKVETKKRKAVKEPEAEGGNNKRRK